MDAREALDLEARFVELHDRFAKEMARTMVEARQARDALHDMSEPMRSLLQMSPWLELREFNVDRRDGPSADRVPRLEFRADNWGGQIIIADGPSPLPAGRYRLMLAIVPLDAAVPEPKK